MRAVVLLPTATLPAIPSTNGASTASVPRKAAVAACSRCIAATPLTLGEADLATLQGINERLDLHEVVEVYLPLSRLLNLRVAAMQRLHASTASVPRKAAVAAC